MDETTRAHAFEPFFTTKPQGKGTGLGLATVYGIIDQSGGAIAVQTAPGHGTSFRIYLPVTTASPSPSVRRSRRWRRREPRRSCWSRTTTPSAKSPRCALRRRGYTVFEARNAEEAIDWTSKERRRADILITDVVMPGLSGPNLAARLIQQNPKLRVLYMSGYTDDATEVHGTFWGGVPLLQKPFTPSQLAERVRMALDANQGMNLAVVAAVIEHANRFLVTRRQDGVHLAGHWEFPGGKVAAGETHAAALRREIIEELDADVVVHDLVLETTHTIPSGRSRCSSIAAICWERRSRCSARRWSGFRVRSCPRWPFPPADDELIRMLTAS